MRNPFSRISSFKFYLFTFVLGLILIGLYAYLFKNSISEISTGLRIIGYLGLSFIGVSVLIVLYKLKWVVLANIALTLVLLLGFEIVSFLSLGMPGFPKKSYQKEFESTSNESKLGNLKYKMGTYSKLMLAGKDTVFNVTYTIDKYFKRKTPDHDNKKKKHALFFGCSIAFGFGLEDHETMASCYQKEDSTINAYNFGLDGHGTNHMLARLQNQDLTEQIKEKKGVAFYLFFWDHIYRSIGSMSRYCDWLSTAPYYEFEDKKLIRNKLFRNGRYFTSRVYEWIYNSSIVAKYKIDLPLKLRDHHYELVTEMILESKKEYQMQFGKNDFLCVIYPSYIAYTTQEMNRFKYFLTKKKIDCIDLSTFMRYGSKHTLIGDPHPNATTNKILSQKLELEYKNLKNHDGIN